MSNKKLSKEQRTERKCQVCGIPFIPGANSYQGIYCNKKCRYKALGYASVRSKINDLYSGEDAQIDYDYSSGNGNYEF
jgi:hypothetical protein